MPSKLLAPDVKVAILPHRAVSGINRVEEARYTLEVLPLEEALQRQFTTDAHFVTYFVPGEKSWPRCNKGVLPQLREKGADLQSQVLVFDIDNPGHAEWTRESYTAFDIHLTHVLEQDPTLASYFAYYTTKHGARLIYLLERPVTVETWEEMTVGMIQLFRAKGLDVDPQCNDWTRLFRLCWVTRDNVVTWNTDFFPFALLEINPHSQPLDVDRVPRVPLHNEAVSVDPAERIPEDLPDLDTLDRLIWHNAARNERSPWYDTAKIRLQGRDYFDALFRNGVLANKGSRNSTIFRSVGSVVSLMITVKDTTPEHIFALFLPAVQQMEEDVDNPESWEEVLWRAIRTTWEKEATKVKSADDPSSLYTGVLAELQQNDLIMGIVEGVRVWCDPLSHLDNEELWRVFERRLILVGSESFYIMKPNGFYDRSVSGQQVASRVRDLGMESLIQTQYVNDKGTLIQLSPEKIARLYGHAIFDVVGSLRFDQGSWLRDVSEDRPAVCEPMYSLNPQLPPVYNEEVDVWLRHLAGADYDKLCTWIAHSLDFAHPIAALFLEGPPSIGKKMLAIGLSENLRVPSLAGSEELVSRFKTQILQTPYIFCNEGFPSSARGSGLKRPADVFREMIDGSPIYVDRKFQHPILVRAPYRLLITANNPSGLRALYGKQDLTPEDREALNIRLLHIKCSDEAAQWLRKRGGPAYTGKEGARWISGDAGEPSNFILAKHFRYLYENRPPVPLGNRFLVEGEPDSAFVEEMSLNSGAAPVVLEVLFSMLQQQQSPTGVKIVERGRIFLTAASILEHAKLMNHPLRRDLNMRNVCDVLRGLGKSSRMRFDDGVQRRWWELNVLLLMREAEKGGSDVVNVLERLRQNLG